MRGLLTPTGYSLNKSCSATGVANTVVAPALAPSKNSLPMRSLNVTCAAYGANSSHRPCGKAGRLGSRRACTPLTTQPTRSRGALRVMAFKEGHRTEQLVETAREWGQAFATGVCSGPSPSVLESLAKLTDTYVTLTSAHPLGCSSHKGLEGMARKIQAEHDALEKAAAVIAGAAPKASACKPRVLLVAADEDADVAFVLLEMPRADGATAYSLMKLDMMLDDTARRVAAVTERQHISGAVVAAPSQGEAAAGPLAAGPTPPLGTTFPTQRLRPWADPNSSTVKDMAIRAMRAWCAARSNCAPSVAAVLPGVHPNAYRDPDALLRPVTDVERFRMYDGYGVLPLICDPKSALGFDDEDDAPPVDPVDPDTGPAPKTGGGGKQHKECVVGFNQILDIIGATQMAFNVQCEIVDKAVCHDMAAGFLHWRTHLSNKATGAEWELHGLEVDLFEPNTGKLNAIYLYRDTMEFEDKMLVEDAAAVARTPIA